MLFILLMVLYVAIGIFISGFALINEPLQSGVINKTILITLFWPVIPVVFIACLPFIGLYKLGEYIGYTIEELIDKLRSR